MLRGSTLIAASVDGYDYDCYTFDVTVIKGGLETHVCFEGSSTTWKGFGRALASFPKKPSDYLFFESGIGSSREEKLLLKAYCYDALGHTALGVTIDNREETPSEFRIRFSIPAEIASLNQLGRLLENWDIQHNSELLWQAQTS